MSGPGYAWWHGMYEVGKKLYTEFLPEVKAVAGPEFYAELTKRYFQPDVRHKWYLKGMSKEQLEEIQTFYNERYGGAAAK